MTDVPMGHITQPLGIMVYNGYYKVMSSIPKMGQLPTPVEEAKFLQVFDPCTVW